MSTSTMRLFGSQWSHSRPRKRSRARRKKKPQQPSFGRLFYIALGLGVVSSVSFFGLLISVMAGG